MTRIKYILLSSLLLLMGCKKWALEVELQDKTLKILEQFTQEQRPYLDTLAYYHEPVFYCMSVNNEGEEIRLQTYLVENNLDEYVEDFKAHSIYNGYDVVIYGDLNPLFYKIDKLKKTSYVHKYGSSEDYIYDPPYWNLYFDKDGKLIKTSPKEVFESLRIEKAK